jgi:hypothetical protein
MEFVLGPQAMDVLDEMIGHGGGCPVRRATWGWRCAATSTAACPCRSAGAEQRSPAVTGCGSGSVEVRRSAPSFRSSGLRACGRGV